MRAWLTLLAFLGLLAGCGERETPRGSAHHRPGPPDVDPRPRLSVTIPPGWHLGREQLLPRMAPPGAILALGTFPPRLDPSGACSRSPGFPQLGVGSREALVMVEEDRRGNSWLAPERPRTVRLGRHFLPWSCLDRRGFAGVRSTFGAAGRLLTVTAIVGPEAPRRTRRQTLAVVESLRFARREHGIEARPVTGRRAGAVRVRMVSGTWTGVRGRMRIVYAAYVSGPSRAGCATEHDAEFPFARAGTRVEAVLRPRAAKGGRWCRGRYRGLIRLHRGFACPARGECRVPPGFPRHTERVARFEFVVR